MPERLLTVHDVSKLTGWSLFKGYLEGSRLALTH